MFLHIASDFFGILYLTVLQFSLHKKNKDKKNPQKTFTSPQVTICIPGQLFFQHKALTLALHQKQIVYQHCLTVLHFCRGWG